MHPRWAPDSSTLIYFTPAATECEDGTLWEIGALGGWPRQIVTASVAGDISHDGQRIALMQPADGPACARRDRQRSIALRACRLAAPRLLYRPCVGRPTAARLRFSGKVGKPGSMVTSRCAAWRPANGAMW